MVRLDTELCRTLDLEHPIVQAPIGGGASPELVGSVADAGGLGMLTVTWRDAEATRALVRETASQTDGRFAVNIVLDPDSKDVPTEEPLTAALDEGVDVVSFSFGDAEPYVDRVHDAGGLVMQTVGNAEEAATAEEAGVDVVVAQGWEAGGHVQSDVATMPLVPSVADAVPDTPVIAAGGIADGRGIAAALTLGADGAWLGTRFLATDEAAIHRLYRQRVLDADETETVYGTPYDEGWPEVPHRVVANETTTEWETAGRPAEDRPGEGDVVAETPDGEPIHRYEDSLAVPGTAGDIEEVPLYAGQSVGLTGDTIPAADLVETLAEETRTTLDRAR